jgi:acyl-CoA thioesterase FadM
MEMTVDCRHEQEARLNARFVLVAMDLDRQRAQAIPDDLRAMMQAFQNGEFDINNHNGRDS